MVKKLIQKKQKGEIAFKTSNLPWQKRQDVGFYNDQRITNLNNYFSTARKFMSKEDQIKQQPHSERPYYKDQNSKIKQDSRIIPVSNVDPVGAFIVGNAVVNKPLQLTAQVGKNILNRLGATNTLESLLNSASRKFDGTVSDEYFKSPDNWYRITQTPEVENIRYFGQNYTTRDVPDDAGNNMWRVNIIDNQLTSKEGYWYKPLEEPYLNITKYGSAHGNMSQASKGIPWGGTTAGAKFPGGILEGGQLNPIHTAKNRSSFYLENWDNIENGSRLGFPSGGMPMQNLKFFKKLPNGRYSFEDVIPEKRIQVEPKLTTTEYAKPWKNGNGVNQAKAYSYDNNLDKGYFELVKDNEPNNWSVHLKTGNYNKYSGKVMSKGTTAQQRSILYDALSNDIPAGDNVSTWGSVSQGGLYGLNKIGQDMTQNGTREVISKETGKPLIIPVFKK